MVVTLPEDADLTQLFSGKGEERFRRGIHLGGQAPHPTQCTGGGRGSIVLCVSAPSRAASPKGKGDTMVSPFPFPHSYSALHAVANASISTQVLHLGWCLCSLVGTQPHDQGSTLV